MNLADLPVLRADNGQPTARAPQRAQGYESLVVCYQSDPKAIAEVLPAPLRPDGSNAVSLQFNATPAASGRGFDVTARISIDAELRGTPVQFIVCSWADEFPASATELDTSRLPGRARIFHLHDQLTAVLDSAGRTLAIASMERRPHLLSRRPRQSPAASIAAWLARPQLHSSAPPALGRHSAAAELICRQYVDIDVVQAISGAAELEFAAPSTHRLPLVSVLGGAHFAADLTPLPARPIDRELHRADRPSNRGLPQELCA